ncbi:hypothetical protein AOV_02190 [Anaplasma ovis str. Haibei]|uniref:Uncharacterized protein n=1 Tax=Anaplasma ovis str. Haibei TaxID=1248439 RepID=A0A2Z2LGE5_9RICK|nr:hypothetical protein [Anaplasma ovis]ASI47671.1 hypothetical protein AOV_02190 [Anaplasma ovis str. Haibei]
MRGINMEGQIANSNSLVNSEEVRRGSLSSSWREKILCATNALLTLFAVCAVISAACVGIAQWRAPAVIRGTAALVCGMALGISMMVFMVYRMIGCCDPVLLLKIDSSVGDRSISRFRDIFSPKRWQGMLRSGTKLTFMSQNYSWYVIKKGVFPHAVCMVPNDDTTAAIRLSGGYITNRFGSHQQFKDVVKRAESVAIVFPKHKFAPPVLMFRFHIGTRADVLRVMSGCSALSSGFGSTFFANYVCIYKHLLLASSAEQADSRCCKILTVSQDMRSLSHREIVNVLTDVAYNKGLFLTVSKFWDKNSSHCGSDEVKTLKDLLKLTASTRLHNKLGSIGENNHLKDNLNLLALIYALLPERSRCFVDGAVDGAILRGRLGDFLKKRPEIKYVAACMDYTIGGMLCERFQDAGYTHSRCFRIFGLLFHSSTTTQQMAKLYEDDLEICMAAFYDFPMLMHCAAYSFMARRFTGETGVDLQDAVRAHNTLRLDHERDGGVARRAASMLYHMCNALGFRFLTHDALSAVIATSVLRLYGDTLENARMGEVLREYNCQAEVPALYNRHHASMIAGHQYEVLAGLTSSSHKFQIQEQALSTAKTPDGSASR